MDLKTLRSIKGDQDFSSLVIMPQTISDNQRDQDKGSFKTAIEALKTKMKKNQSNERNVQKVQKENKTEKKEKSPTRGRSSEDKAPSMTLFSQSKQIEDIEQVVKDETGLNMILELSVSDDQLPDISEDAIESKGEQSVDGSIKDEILRQSYMSF